MQTAPALPRASGVVRQRDPRDDVAASGAVPAAPVLPAQPQLASHSSPQMQTQAQQRQQESSDNMPMTQPPMTQAPLQGCTVVLSGFQNPQRGQLRDSAMALGATCAPDWGPGCTHLVCAVAGTPKFHDVLRSGFGWIVSREWIEQCFAAKRRLPEQQYFVGSGGPSALTLPRENATKNVTAAAAAQHKNNNNTNAVQRPQQQPQQSLSRNQSSSLPPSPVKPVTRTLFTAAVASGTLPLLSAPVPLPPPPPPPPPAPPVTTVPQPQHVTALLAPAAPVYTYKQPVPVQPQSRLSGPHQAALANVQRQQQQQQQVQQQQAAPLRPLSNGRATVYLDFDQRANDTVQDVQQLLSGIMRRLVKEKFVETTSAVQIIAFGVPHSFRNPDVLHQLSILGVETRLVSARKKEETDRQLERDALNGKIDSVVVIVSSDQDFTFCARKLVQDGKRVIVVHDAKAGTTHENNLQLFPTAAWRFSDFVSSRKPMFQQGDFH